MKGFIDDRLAEISRLYPVWEKKTIWKFFEATAERFPEWEFVGAQGRESYSYRQTKEIALRIARKLRRYGRVKQHSFDRRRNDTGTPCLKPAHHTTHIVVRSISPSRSVWSHR